MKDIIIYSTHTCGFCNMLKRYLDDQKIGYSVKYADEDQAIAQELYEKSGQLGVPFTIFVGNDGSETNVLGFDKPRIDQLLGLA